MSGASSTGEERGAPRAVILGCAGEGLSPAERSFFHAADPAGFILFRRNCREPAQVRDLVAAMREAIGRDDAPILIDQEGGRVARLGPPHWRLFPSAGRLGSLPDPQAAAAARLGARLIADDLRGLGITIDCLPVLDLPVVGADRVIGDRAYGNEPGRVASLGRAVCEGLLEGGVLPVIKHIPGHGRALLDSHHACPVVETGADELSHRFYRFAGSPVCLGDDCPYRVHGNRPDGTGDLVRRVISQTIRGDIGFDGVLVSDDLSMQALGGEVAERASRALAAGCDLVLHCNGDRREMEAIAAATGPISPPTAARLARAEAIRRASGPQHFDRHEGEKRFEALLAGAEISELANQ
jgi:beta-N-acetylhexosaminidase